MVTQKHIHRVILAWTFVSVVRVAVAESREAEGGDHIKHAKTYYWLGMTENGNMEAFRRGRELLATALKDPAAPKAQIEALRADIKHQAVMARDTLYGVFPLVRLLGPTLFADAAATGTFELVDDPDVIAATAAGADLCDKVLQEWKPQAQLDAVFTSLPRRQDLENEILYIFSRSVKFFVHNYEQLAAALSEDELKAFQAGGFWPGSDQEKAPPGESTGFPSETRRKLFKAFGISRLLVVVVRQRDVVEDNYFYNVDGHLYAAQDDEPVHSLYRMGFCRDRRAQFWPIVLTNAALLCLAAAAYSLLIRLRAVPQPSLPRLVAISSASFLVGRVMPWVLAPMLSAICPEPETLAVLSFWWPCIAGAVLLLGPALAYKIASTRLQNLAEAFNVDGKGGAVFTAVAIGVCAYLAGPLFLFREGDAVRSLVPLVIGVGVISYVLGRSLDKVDRLPWYAAAVPIVGALGIGAAYCHASSPHLWAAAGAVTGAGALVMLPVWKREWRRRREEAEREGAYGELAPSDLPADGHELAQRAEAPSYRPFQAFADARPTVEGALSGKTVWLALTGRSGIGKTATARAVIADLEEQLRKRGREMTALFGECPKQESEGAAAAYAPFRKALARCFEVDLLGQPEEQLEHIDAALGGMFESFVPFAGLLFPPAESASSSASTKKHIHISVAATVRRLARKKTVVLFIDDAQWMDDASRELFAFLLKEFPAGEGLPLAIIVTGRDKEKLATLGTEGHIVDVKLPNEGQRTQILVGSLGLRTDVARTIVGKVGTGGTEQGELFWLFRVVSHLANSNVFRREEDGFTWAEEYADPDKLPVPDEYRTALEEQLRRFPEYRSILECGACLGMESSASVLADSLERPRLEVLRLLDRVEDETGMLVDLRESDDAYAFRSSFMLEVIRKNSRITGSGPKSEEVPQLIREYHARVAASLEKTLERSSSALFEVANQYYAAGASRAEKALEYCLKAARAASRNFNHDQARAYLGMAAECADLLKREREMEEEFLLIECDIAHVEGEEDTLQAAAEKGLAYIEEHGDAPVTVLVAAARACYDARRFEDAVRVGRAIIERAKSSAEKAEGFHFVGVSLPLGSTEEREKNLRQALKELAGTPEDDLPAQALLARVSNSLAEQLSPVSPDEARSFFEDSRGIKERIRDLPGLARTHGGLGRLAFFGKPLDSSKAREHFREDLRISEKIGDVRGRTQMHSFLGKCDRLEGGFDGAIEHYGKSLALSQDPVAKLFAGAGLLECYCEKNLKEDVDRLGRELLVVAKEAKGIPKGCAADLADALSKCAGRTEESWLSELASLVKEAAKA